MRQKQQVIRNRLQPLGRQSIDFPPDLPTTLHCVHANIGSDNSGRRWRAGRPIIPPLDRTDSLKLLEAVMLARVDSPRSGGTVICATGPVGQQLDDGALCPRMRKPSLLREIRDLQKAHFERYQEFTAAALQRQEDAVGRQERLSASASQEREAAQQYRLQMQRYVAETRANATRSRTISHRGSVVLQFHPLPCARLHHSRLAVAVAQPI